jgi:hypothetical protein
MNIPEDYIEFLHWVKETTETFWNKEPVTQEEGLSPEEWVEGAKWLGLEEEEIDAIEDKYQIKFTQEHRAFLNILHTIDRKEPIECYDDNSELYYIEKSFFHNWKTDDEELNYCFNWPSETILTDVLGVNKIWLKSWGKVRPKSDVTKKEIFSNWLKQAPKLIPIFGHRFVVSTPSDCDNPILSVYGSDVIVYGWNMRHYLLSELKEHLELMYWDCNEEYGCSIEKGKELQDLCKKEYAAAKDKRIPFWEDMILYWSSGWSSFGRKYPYYPQGGPSPIVNSYVAEDEK